MTIRINPKLLDVVQIKDSPFKIGETQHGTIIELLGGSPEAVLIEVLDDQGVPRAIVRRTVDEIEPVSAKREISEPESKLSEAQLCFESGILLLQNGWHEQAKEQFSKSFSLDPKYRGGLLNTTNELAAKGAFEPAILVYTILLEISPDYKLARENFAIVLMNRAIVLAQHGLFSQAMEGYRKALALNPSVATRRRIRENMVATYTQLGLFYSHANQYELASECFQKAFELDQSEVSRKNLGVAMIAVFTAGSGNRAAELRAEMFREPLLMGLTLSECLTAYGATLATLGDVSEARRALREALEADPQNSIAGHNLEVLSDQESSEGIRTGLVSIQSQPLEAGHV